MKQLALEGQIVDVLLVQGDRVLVLRIDEVSRYACALVVAARDHPSGVPMLEPQTILSAAMSFPGIQEHERLDRTAERVVIECVVQLLLERGICFEHSGIVVFPTLFTQAAPSGPACAHARPLFYDFDGPIDNIYASLIARLAVSGQWGAVRVWRNRAEFEQDEEHILAIGREDRGRGQGHLDLYISSHVPSERRDLFIDFVEDHLRRNGVEVVSGLSFTCSCGKFHFDETLLRDRIAEARADVRCPRCDRVYPLFSRASTPATSATRLRALKTETERRTREVVAEVKEAMQDGIGVGRSAEPIRILHLSDLHFTGDRSVEQVLEPLDADLRDQLQVRKLDYVVVSGDLAHQCNAMGFTRAEEFLRSLAANFGLNASRLIVVPGNHDSDRNRRVYELELDETKALRQLAESRVRKDDVYLICQTAEYPKRFDQFRRCYKAITQADYPEPHELQGLILSFPEDAIEFLTLNSAWQIDRFYPERITINGDALSKALLRSRPDMKLRIVVWHHAVTGVRRVANPEHIDRLIQKGYRLCLHGDVHEERNELLNHFDASRSFYIVGAGSFSSADSGLPPATPRLYNLIEIDRQFHRLRIRSRAQRRFDGAFEPFAIYPGHDPDTRRADYWITL